LIINSLKSLKLINQAKFLKLERRLLCVKTGKGCWTNLSLFRGQRGEKVYEQLGFRLRRPATTSFSIHYDIFRFPLRAAALRPRKSTFASGGRGRCLRRPTGEYLLDARPNGKRLKYRARQ